MAPELFSVYGLPLLDDTLKLYRKSLRIDARMAGVVLTRFPRSEDARFSQAEGHRERIRSECARLKIPFLEAIISAHNAYPASFESAEALPFSKDKEVEPLVTEIEKLAIELGLVKEGKA